MPRLTDVGISGYSSAASLEYERGATSRRRARGPQRGSRVGVRVTDAAGRSDRGASSVQRYTEMKKGLANVPFPNDRQEIETIRRTPRLLTPARSSVICSREPGAVNSIIWIQVLIAFYFLRFFS